MAESTITAAQRAACSRMRRLARARRRGKALSASSTSVRVPECTNASHDALKRNPAAWARLTLIGFQATYAEFPEPNALEMRNCGCGSTLCLPVHKRMHLGKVVDETAAEVARG